VALLLTDDVGLASDALAEVLYAHPDLARVGETMVERSIVQACRLKERGTGGVQLDGSAAGRSLWNAARRLDDQPWQAWILRELEEEDEIRVARAMDCSKTAIAAVHLGPAIEVLRSGNPGYDAALADLRAGLATLDVRPILDAGRIARNRAITRQRMITGVQLLLLAVCFGLLLYVLYDLLGWDEREAEKHLHEDPFSNPIPESTP